MSAKSIAPRLAALTLAAAQCFVGSASACKTRVYPENFPLKELTLMRITPKLQAAFYSWVDKALTGPIPKGTVAFHFNLYEGKRSFHIQLIGSEQFSRDDPDWPCHETLTTGEDIFELPHSVVGTEWEDCLELAKAAVVEYLGAGGKASVLRASKGVGVGFVDGDVEVVWEASAA